MNGHTNGILVTGCAGNGKTTFTKILYLLLSQAGLAQGSEIERADMSDIIKWCKNKDTELGKEIRDQNELMLKGWLLAEPLPIRAYLSWFTQSICHRSTCVKLLLLAGAPRNTNQLLILDTFCKALIIHMLADRETSDRAIEERLRKDGGNGRPDDRGGKEIMNTRRREYEQETLPAMSILMSRKLVLVLDRKEPLATRLEKALSHMSLHPESSPVDPVIIQNALSILEDENHEVSKLIQDVETGKA